MLVDGLSALLAAMPECTKTHKSSIIWKYCGQIRLLQTLECVVE